MNKNDLKNGMIFEMRNKSRFLILNNEIYHKDICHYEYFEKLHYFLESYNDDMFSMNDNKYDIMKVLDCDNNVIWERKEIDWTKVPVDTKVLVRDSKKEEWCKRYFAEYKDGIFYTFNNAGTSWSTSNEISWREYKLAEEPKEKITVSVKDLCKAFKTMCESHNCNCCDYDGGDGTCEIRWISDNYNITKK